MKNSFLLSLNLVWVFFFISACSSTMEESEAAPTVPSNILTSLNETTVIAVEYTCPDTVLTAGKWSNSKAEDKTGAIYGMQLTSRYFDWKNPTSGGAIHINQNDEIEVYQFTLDMMYMGLGLDEAGDTVVIKDLVPKDTSVLVSPDELMLNVGGVGFGNPTSILITSEYDLKKSKSLKKILDVICAYPVQVFFLVGKR